LAGPGRGFGAADRALARRPLRHRPFRRPVDVEPHSAPPVVGLEYYQQEGWGERETTSRGIRPGLAVSSSPQPPPRPKPKRNPRLSCPFPTGGGPLSKWVVGGGGSRVPPGWGSDPTATSGTTGAGGPPRRSLTHWMT